MNTTLLFGQKYLWVILAFDGFIQQFPDNLFYICTLVSLVHHYDEDNDLLCLYDLVRVFLIRDIHGFFSDLFCEQIL